MNTVNSKDIRKWLEAQGQKAILDMLMTQVESDGRLCQELVLKIAKENARGIDLAAYRTAISNACLVDGYLDYGNVYTRPLKVYSGWFCCNGGVTKVKLSSCS